MARVLSKYRGHGSLQRHNRNNSNDTKTSFFSSSIQKLNCSPRKYRHNLFSSPSHLNFQNNEAQDLNQIQDISPSNSHNGSPNTIPLRKKSISENIASKDLQDEDCVTDDDNDKYLEQESDSKSFKSKLRTSPRKNYNINYISKKSASFESNSSPNFTDCFTSKSQTDTKCLNLEDSSIWDLPDENISKISIISSSKLKKYFPSTTKVHNLNKSPKNHTENECLKSTEEPRSLSGTSQLKKVSSTLEKDFNNTDNKISIQGNNLLDDLIKLQSSTVQNHNSTDTQYENLTDLSSLLSRKKSESKGKFQNSTQKKQNKFRKDSKESLKYLDDWNFFDITHEFNEANKSKSDSQEKLLDLEDQSERGMINTPKKNFKSSLNSLNKLNSITESKLGKDGKKSNLLKKLERSKSVTEEEKINKNDNETSNSIGEPFKGKSQIISELQVRTESNTEMSYKNNQLQNNNEYVDYYKKSKTVKIGYCSRNSFLNGPQNLEENEVDEIDPILNDINYQRKFHNNLATSLDSNLVHSSFHLRDTGESYFVNDELQGILDELETQSGLVPICLILLRLAELLFDPELLKNYSESEISQKFLKSTCKVILKYFQKGKDLSILEHYAFFTILVVLNFSIHNEATALLVLKDRKIVEFLVEFLKYDMNINDMISLYKKEKNEKKTLFVGKKVHVITEKISNLENSDKILQSNSSISSAFIATLTFVSIFDNLFCSPEDKLVLIFKLQTVEKAIKYLFNCISVFKNNSLCSSIEKKHGQVLISFQLLQLIFQGIIEVEDGSGCYDLPTFFKLKDPEIIDLQQVIIFILKDKQLTKDFLIPALQFATVTATNNTYILEKYSNSKSFMNALNDRLQQSFKKFSVLSTDNYKEEGNECNIRLFILGFVFILTDQESGIKGIINHLNINNLIKNWDLLMTEKEDKNNGKSDLDETIGYLALILCRICIFIKKSNKDMAIKYDYLITKRKAICESLCIFKKDSMMKQVGLNSIEASDIMQKNLSKFEDYIEELLSEMSQLDNENIITKANN